MRHGVAQVFIVLTKRDFRRVSDNSGHCAWVRKQFLPWPSVGYHSVAVKLWKDHELSSGRTARLGRGYVALES